MSCTNAATYLSFQLAKHEEKKYLASKDTKWQLPRAYVTRRLLNASCTSVRDNLHMDK